MAEAVEICKLRLFLKLVAQVTKPDELEPLPDIDFNILAGNTLIGFTNLDEVRQVVARSLIAGATLSHALADIEQQAKAIERTEHDFRRLETEYKVDQDGSKLRECKQSLRTQLHKLRADLDSYLAPEYGIDSHNIPDKRTYQERYEQWRKSHQPFHWWVEFYEIMKCNGFDVIIGNPPYLEYSKVRKEYKIARYETKSCGNLYAAVIERSLALCSPGQSYLGLIVPLSICGGERFEQLRSLINANMNHIYLANFEIFPSRLFHGAFQRLTILLAQHSREEQSTFHATKIQRWYAQERSHLIYLLIYTTTNCSVKPGVFPKLASSLQDIILAKVIAQSRGNSLDKVLSVHKTTNFVYYQEATNYWMKATCRIPFYKKNGTVMEPTHGRFLYFCDEQMARTIMALMNSSLFYIWFATYADGFHLSHTLVKDFPLWRDKCIIYELVQLFTRLGQDIQLHAKLSTRNTKPDSKLNKEGHSIELEEYGMTHSKPLFDDIDKVLAQIYGFSNEELDFIVNYDIKYRMGLNNEGEE